MTYFHHRVGEEPVEIAPWDEPLLPPLTPVSLSYGGGVNGAAMLARLIETGERLDQILFADTGRWLEEPGEWPETYASVAWYDQWTRAQGYCPITVVRYLIRGTDTLYAASLRNRTYPSLAFHFRGCSIKHKHQPMNAYRHASPECRAAWARGEKPIVLIGYDAGEGHRKVDIGEDEHFRYRYPLIEWGWHREDCVEYLHTRGLPVPRSSACYYCPASQEHDLRLLAVSHPTLAHRTVELERNAKGNVDDDRGLGGTGRFFEPILLGAPAQGRLFDARAPDLACGCMV